MAAPENTFKHSAKNSDVTYGVWNGFVNPTAGEILADSGFDWMVIDGEHAPFDLRSILTQLQP